MRGAFERMSDAQRGSCLVWSYKRTNRRLELLARILLFQVALVLGAQLLQARLHGGELVEVAIPCGTRQLELVDRGGDTAAQRINLGLRLVLAQPLAEGRVRLRLHFTQARVARVQAHLRLDHGERLVAAPQSAERLCVGVHDRAAIRPARRALLEERKCLAVLSLGLAD